MKYKPYHFGNVVQATASIVLAREDAEDQILYADEEETVDYKKRKPNRRYPRNGI